MEFILTEEEQLFLNTMSKVVISSNEKFMYMPYWFQDLGNDIFKRLSFDDLPNHLKATIKEMRNEENTNKQ